MVATSATQSKAHLRCGNIDAYCAAANLARLYSAGGDIATSVCPAWTPDCEKRLLVALIDAAQRYRDYVRLLRSRSLDLTFAGRFDNTGNVSANDIKEFIDQRLALLTKRCDLSTMECVRAETYLFADVDQAVRQYPNCSVKSAVADCRAVKQANMARVDFASSKFVSKVLSKYGWLTAGAWGRSTEDNFWLLVQHADADLKLQRRALGALKRAKPSISFIHLAYLEDRVRVHEGRRQLYGTQGRCLTENGRPFWRPDPIEDEPQLNRRRKAIGMQPMAVHTQEGIQACKQL